MVAALQAGPCKIQFVKKDGTVRTMLATLEESTLPPSTSTGTRASSPAVLPVFDVEADGWRSFRLDSLISFNPVSDEDNGEGEEEGF